MFGPIAAVLLTTSAAGGTYAVGETLGGDPSAADFQPRSSISCTHGSETLSYPASEVVVRMCADTRTTGR